jgi:predicted oxidoreductase
MRVPYLPLHEQGLLCSRIVLGAWRLAEWKMTTSDLRKLIDTCLELGITTIDHADIYGNYTCEGLFGAALRENPKLRDSLQLISKCGIKLVSVNRPTHAIKHYDTSRNHILASVDHSLRQLQTDYLDLLLIHRPDPFMDADETADALMALVQSGKVKHVGASNFMPSQFELLSSRLNLPLVTNQLEISVMHLDAFLDGTLDQCQRLRMAPMAWSPLGGGELFRSATPQSKRLQRGLTVIGKQLGGVTPDQVALAWLLSHPANIVPILGTGKLDRIRSAAAASAVRLTREQWFALWRASTGVEVP